MATEQAPLDNPPETIRVLGKDVKITMDGSKKFKDFGETLIGDLKVRIHTDQHPSQKRDTLLHELFHVLEKQFNFDIDHTFIHVLATGFYQILRENPELVKWLLKEEQQ